MADPPELVELRPADLPSITALLGELSEAPRLGELPEAPWLGELPEAHWVGVRIGERLVAAAGWTPVAGGVRLIGPRVEQGRQDQGFEEALIGAVEELAAESNEGNLAFIEARADPRLHALGYRAQAAVFVRRLPEVVDVPTAADMKALGRHLAGLFRPGDLVIATGDLGAGKTTLTQGIGEGLGVDEPVTSPTFVLSRIHPGAPGRPDLVHVDVYRLADADEVDDLDLDHDLDTSVTVIEWGAGLAEQLADDRLEITIRRRDDPAAEGRSVILRPVGERWEAVRLAPPEGARP